MEIDEEDFDKIKDFNLTLNCDSNKNTHYAKSVIYENNKYVKKIHIHRFIMGLGDFKNDKRIINHIDGNGLNNKKNNLEICNCMYNSQSVNRIHHKTKGYSFENDPKRKCKWRVSIKIYGKNIRKRFLTEEECIEFIDTLKR